MVSGSLSVFGGGRADKLAASSSEKLLSSEEVSAQPKGDYEHSGAANNVPKPDTRDSSRESVSVPTMRTAQSAASTSTWRTEAILMANAVKRVKQSIWGVWGDFGNWRKHGTENVAR